MNPPSFPRPWRIAAAAVSALLSAGGAYWALAHGGAPQDAGAASAAPRATLTVTTVKPQPADWPQVLAADGNVAAWQEAVIGSEDGLRLTEVLANVGDAVRRGQVLARFAAERVAAEVAHKEAAVDEAQAALAEAAANAERARMLSASGMMSAQQSLQLVTAERSAQARLLSARTSLRIDQIRLAQTRLLAPDDGVISSRSAAVGTVAPQGMELFRLIRQGRLEWRAEVAADQVARLHPGQPVSVTGATGAVAQGRVRMIAPTLDPASRRALVYVDLPPGPGLQAGMFATGRFDLGHAAALAVPQAAVVTRDGRDYVYRVVAGKKVVQTRVALGRRLGDLVEVVSGASADMTLVAQGAGFLADGDTVQLTVMLE